MIWVLPDLSATETRSRFADRDQAKWGRNGDPGPDPLISRARLAASRGKKKKEPRCLPFDFFRALPLEESRPQASQGVPVEGPFRCPSPDAIGRIAWGVERQTNLRRSAGWRPARQRGFWTKRPTTQWHRGQGGFSWKRGKLAKLEELSPLRMQHRLADPPVWAVTRPPKTTPRRAPRAWRWSHGRAPPRRRGRWHLQVPASCPSSVCPRC